MKKKILFSTIAVLLLASFVSPGRALAGDISRFRGLSANAFFFSTDGDCIETFTSVFASHNQFQNPPGPGSSQTEVFVFVEQFDICNGVSLLAADGFAVVDPGDFTIDRNLNAASLNTTIEVFDFVNETSFPLDISVDWSGVGEITRGNSHSNFGSPGCRFIDRFHGEFRAADASGVITDGETNFSPDPAEFAELVSAKSGSVIIGCGF